MHPFPEIKKNFGFGMKRLPMIGETVDEKTVCAMVDAFLSRGFNYFDTAHPYIKGQSETAIRDCLAARHSREEFVLTNKLSDGCWSTAADIVPLLEEQLRQCGVSYFDFYLMHAMNAKRHERYQQEGAYDIAQQQKALGRIRHVGISFHDSAEVLDKILTARPEIEVVQLQLNYADWDDAKVQSRLCYEVCVRHGKPVLVMEPVKGGSLANLPAEAAALLPDGSPASYAIRFAAGLENVCMVLSGMSTMEQMEDNLSFMEDFQPLSQQEQALVQQVKTIYQSRTRIPCTACRYCEEQCPAGIPISTVFAQINQLHAGEGNPKSDYAALETQADSCLGCGKCVLACPQHLNVRQLLEMSHSLLK